MELIQGKSIHCGIAIGYIQLLQDDLIDDSRIIMCSDLTPRETISFGEKGVSALLVTNATPTSHTSIISRTMDIPAIAGIDVNDLFDGKQCIVDGEKGIIIIDPNEETIRMYQQKRKSDIEENKTLADTYGKSFVKTKSGKAIPVYANISLPSDKELAIKNGSDGIGVFKSEFAYLNLHRFPTEDELYSIYNDIALSMPNKKVVFRTIDIGSDKTSDYMNIDKEENPALGLRAIRLCLKHLYVFKTQLRAILRASSHGNVAIMYPMIISVDEVIKIKEIMKSTMLELKKEGISFDEHIEQGIMIETPAASILSDELAKYVDFFSIGTNDLTQYMLAADRQNPNLSNYYNPNHPAIKRSIRQIIANAHKENIWVEISGELGGNPDAIEWLIEYGVDALAVSPSKILKIKKRITELL